MSLNLALLLLVTANTLNESKQKCNPVPTRPRATGYAKIARLFHKILNNA
jgi:hypothetical protein